MPKEGATMAEIGDIGEVAEDDLPVDDTIGRAEVAGVLTLASYLSCLACKSKVEPTTDKMGKCKMDQNMERCKTQLNAKMVVTCGDSYLTLNAFGSNVMDVAEKEVKSLLCARPFTLTYTGSLAEIYTDRFITPSVGSYVFAVIAEFCNDEF